MHLIKKHIPHKGQSYIVGFIFSMLMLSFFSYSLYLGTSAYKKAQLKNRTDAVAYSGAVVEAKILNSVSALNEGIVFVNNLITKIVLVWLFLKACAALCLIGFCPCLGPLRIFNRIAKPILKKLKAFSWAMANLQDQILKFGRVFVISEMHKIAKQNGLKSFRFYPCNPFGGTRAKSSLGFFLKRANSKNDLVDSKLTKQAIKTSIGSGDDLMSCYQKTWMASQYMEARNYYVYKAQNVDFTYLAEGREDISFEEPRGEIFSDKIDSKGKVLYKFKKAQATVCKKVSSILKGGLKLPNPLIKVNDFRSRMHLIVLASTKPFTNFTAFIKGGLDNHKFWAVSQAKPQGNSVFDMEWHASLERVNIPKDTLSVSVCFQEKLIASSLLIFPDLLRH